MKRKIILIILTVCVAFQGMIIMPMSVSAWSYKDNGKYETATHKAPIVESGSIVMDAKLDDCYIAGNKITSYDDNSPYLRKVYKDVFDIANGKFFAYIAVSTEGLFVYAEIEDETIFSSTNTNGNDGDCFQIYLDWCPEGMKHPASSELYSKYKNGTPWDYAAYKTNNAINKGGQQYLGWLSGDYNGVVGGMGGFNSLNKMGPNKNESLTYKTRFTDDGWACEWFIPWRDQAQKNAVANGDQFHCGIGFQANDDADINDAVTPGTEQNTAVTFDQRREIGDHYWADYSMLSDIAFVDACNHSWNVQDSAGNTCTAYGYSVYECSVCKGEKTERTEAAHMNTVEYICTEAGMKEIVCADCGEIIDSAVPVNTVGMPESHVYESLGGEVEPTCTEGGDDYLECKYCSDAKETVLPALGHSCKYNNKAGKYLCERCGLEIIHGDANGDGFITNVDVLIIFKYIYNADMYPIPIFEAADVNMDGEVNNADVLCIFRYIYNPEKYAIKREQEEFQLNGINVSEYTIVYPKKNRTAVQLAEKLCDAIEEVSGVRIKMVSDSEPYRNGREILVGYSKRITGEARSIITAIKRIEDGEYLAFREGDFLYVGGKEGDDIMLAAAANKLVAAIRNANGNYAEINVSDGVKPEGTKYSVITYNDGDNSTTITSQVATILNYYSPDIIGMQEVQSKHISTYEALMPGYKGIYYDHDTHWYGAPIFYKTSKFTVVESGTQWLSDTPDIKYSVFEESDYIRSYVYAVLRDKSTGDEIVVVNTHVDYIAEANIKQIEVLLDCTERFRDKTVIYTGDFNMQVTSHGYREMYDSGLIDCGNVVNGVPMYGHIDFCFVDLATALPVAYKYIDDHTYSATASDHKPVYSEILVNVK